MSSERHPLLVRQLQRLGLPPELLQTQLWATFIETVSATYHESDQDRDMLERAMTISSREMRQLHDDLARSASKQIAQHRDKVLETDAVKAAVVEASPDGILVIDDARRVAFCNRRFAEIWRIPEEVFASGDDHRLLEAAISRLLDPTQFLAKVEALYSSPNAHSEDVLELSDGTILERFSRPAVDANQVVRGRLWIFRDVTAARRDVARLREAHAFLDSILETLPNMVFVKDATDLRFVRFNRAGEQLLGIERAALLGRTAHELFTAEQADVLLANDRQVLAQRGVVTIAEEEIHTPLGPRRLRTRKTPIFGPDDKALYLLGISEDITDERARSAELYLAKERAESATRSKSNFLLNMSHELRTPLNAILGFARVLGRVTRDRLSEGERDHLADIVAAGEHMLHLINDLLDLRSLEAL
ncbi:MAG: PAS domain-containing protein, partial [Myxococcales bacterium]|nr:PAS domain-containing protein [Myxococcales bacterium]